MKMLKFYAKEVDIGFLDVFINHILIKSPFFMGKMMKKWKNFLEYHHFIIYNS